METEKITINLGMVELGKVDVLVEHGLFSNRSDFIRTAIRERLAVYENEIRELTKPPLVDTTNTKGNKQWTWTMGILNLSRPTLLEAQADGKRYSITVVGIMAVDHKVTPELFAATVEHVKVYGKLMASDEIKTLIKQMDEQ